VEEEDAVAADAGDEVWEGVEGESVSVKVEGELVAFFRPLLYIAYAGLVSLSIHGMLLQEIYLLLIVKY
jgi:hypothetical protein